MQILSDEKLMVLYQNGDEMAFQELYARHSKKVYAYLRKRIRQEELVNDTYQDVFIKVHRSKRLYNSSLPVLPWLFTITRSVMIDNLRKLQKTETDDSFDMNTLSVEPSLNLAGHAQLLSDRLPENQKIAVQMRYVDESTFEEIAERLKTSPTNVRQIISRGIKRLKQLMEDKDPL